MATPLEVEIGATEAVGDARRGARRLAEQIGFDAVGAEEIAIVVSELGSNLVRYARRGRLRIGRVDGEPGAGLEVVSEDDGPGIADVRQAVVDGFSTGGGLGGGLGAVHRLADEVAIESSERGTRIVARKWLRRSE